jgi:DNA-binding MarR family transcriptional regulator
MAVPASKLTLPDALAQLSFAVQSAIGRVAERYDLSLVQMRLLGILRDREPAMFALATFLSLDKSSVTGLVDRAERRSLVRRTTTPEDRRTVRVALTGEGRQLAQNLAKQVERELSLLVEGLSEGDRRRLLAIAGRIVAADGQRRGLPVTPPTNERPPRRRAARVGLPRAPDLGLPARSKR